MSGPFGTENDILDRLQERFGPLATVASGGAISQQGLSVGELAIPLVIVEPLDTGLRDIATKADHIIEDQAWLVSIVARHTADPDRLRVDYSEIDTLVETGIRALTGWKPASGVREFRYQGREDMLHEPGLIEVGLRFGTYYHLSVTD